MGVRHLRVEMLRLLENLRNNNFEQKNEPEFICVKIVLNSTSFLIEIEIDF
jgi:hypothetical protein